MGKNLCTQISIIGFSRSYSLCCVEPWRGWVWIVIAVGAARVHGAAEERRGHAARGDGGAAAGVRAQPQVQRQGLSDGRRRAEVLPVRLLVSWNIQQSYECLRDERLGIVARSEQEMQR